MKTKNNLLLKSMWMGVYTVYNDDEFSSLEDSFVIKGNLASVTAEELPVGE